MSRFAQLVIIGLAAAAASMASRADECEFTAQRSAKIAAAGASRVQISARAGSLVIEGIKGAGQVEASGKACAPTQRYLDEVQIETRRDGDVLFVTVRVPDLEKMATGSDDSYASLDLRVAVPDRLAVRALDSSGEAEVRDVASLDVTDSSGALRIHDVRGDVAVRDSSGELQVRNVGGSLKLNDSSGDVNVDGVERDVLVDVDSSGNLDIERVKGNVRINQDSSGDIRIADVGGEVRIDTDSSGGVDVRRVGGAFTLSTKGSGDVQVADVKGEVKVPPR